MMITNLDMADCYKNFSHLLDHDICVLCEMELDCHMFDF
jgi:hypothetical protein